MSALSHEPGFLDEPPARRNRAAGEWNWPDLTETLPPPVAAPARNTGGQGAAPRWPVSPPAGSWPPMPDPQAEARADLRAAPRSVEADLRAEPDLAPPAFERPQPRPAAQAEAPRPLPAYALQPGVTATAPAAAVGAPLRRDPSPSRLTYRLNRLWLTPMVRHFVRFGLPLLVLAAVAGGWLARADNRAALESWTAGVVERVQHQPMFMVNSIAVQSRSPEVAAGVEQLLGLSFPVSSWDLDLNALRARAESLDAVDHAWLQIRSGGVLEVRVDERVPAMVWRNGAGLELVDATGTRIARLASRAARGDLPLIVGEGAPAAITEARLLWAAAAPLEGRLRGLVRVGERRWDLVLDRNQRILLPAEGALGALEWVIGQDAAQQLLSREVLVVDMRAPARPTLRLSEDAMGELNRNRPALAGR